MSKKLKLEDLKVGMNVKKEQLEDIFGVTIYFDNYNDTNGGTIIFIESDNNKASLQELYAIIDSNNNTISTFYQDPDYKNGEVVIIE